MAVLLDIVTALVFINVKEYVPLKASKIEGLNTALKFSDINFALTTETSKTPNWKKVLLSELH